MKENIDNDIIIAITAAIASIDVKPGYKLVVKSYKRIPQVSPIWSSTGKIERMKRSL